MIPAQNILVDLILFVVALFFLVKSANILIHSLNILSRSSKIEIFALVGFFSALATNLPELFVAITSGLSGKSEMVLGVALGSNIVNSTLIIGSAAIVGGSLAVVADFVKKDVLRAFIAAAFPLLLMVDGQLSRLDGLLLLLVFAAYHVAVFKEKHQYINNNKTIPFKQVGKWLHQVNKHYSPHQAGWLGLAVVMLLFSAEMVVQTGSRVAVDLNLPVLLVGLLLVSVGTSLPELALEARAARLKQTGVVFGNLLGSLVANSTLVLGIAVFLSPITIAQPEKITQAALVFLLGFFLLWVFIRTKYKLQRWEGMVLVLLYLGFVITQLI